MISVFQFILGFIISAAGGWLILILLGSVTYTLQIPGDEIYGPAWLVVWSLAVYYFTKAKYPLVSRGALWGLGLVILYLAALIFFVVTGARISF